MLAAVAKIFGYSMPMNLNYDIMVPNPRASLAVVDTKYPGNKLSVDSKQELTLDPRTTGIQGDDELPIASIAGRESYLTTFDWDQNTAVDTLLFSCRVDPFVYATNLTASTSSTEIHLPACAYAVLPFKYWRGTMRFRFQIVSSAYHKGRLRVVYDPEQAIASPGYNTQYTTIHDISSEKDFTVDVGWGQTTSYREKLDRADAAFSTTPLALPSTAATNGNIAIYVVNQLTTPGIVAADLQVNVFVSMLDDFEVAQPTRDVTNYTRRLPEFTPEMGFAFPEMGMEDDMDCCDNPVADPPVIDTHAHIKIQDDDVTKLFFGEAIASFRQMMKRTCLAEFVRVPENTVATRFAFNRAAFPEQSGLYAGGLATNSMVLQLSDGSQIVPTANNYLTYLALAFADYRGSTRWVIDTSSLNVQGNGDRFNSLTILLNRAESIFRQFFTSVLVPATAPNNNLIITSINAEKNQNMLGQYLGNTNVNPIQAIEVPFYSPRRFVPTMFEYAYDQQYPYPGFNFSAVLPGTDSTDEVSFVRLYCSAGEDLNFFFYQGPPVVFYEPSFNLDPGP